MKVLIVSNQNFEVVVPGIPGIFVFKTGENEVKDRGEFKALDLANSIVKDHGNDNTDRKLSVVVK